VEILGGRWRRRRATSDVRDERFGEKCVSRQKSSAKILPLLAGELARNFIFIPKYAYFKMARLTERQCACLKVQQQTTSSKQRPKPPPNDNDCRIGH